MLAKWYGDKVTIIAADQFICLQVSEAEALAKLKARGVYGVRAQAVLRRKATHAEWISTHSSAVAAVAVATAEAVSRAAEAADLEDVRNRQSELSSALTELQRGMESDRLRLERRQLEIHLGYEAERHTQIALSTGLAPGRDLEAAIWAQLWETPAGLRLQELRESA
ncbi:MAG: hypothetical protein C0485_01825 [Pirellula sp.]|nr:hypothetical protein [Pirellula sp.]